MRVGEIRRSNLLLAVIVTRALLMYEPGKVIASKCASSPRKEGRRMIDMTFFGGVLDVNRRDPSTHCTLTDPHLPTRARENVRHPRRHPHQSPSKRNPPSGWRRDPPSARVERTTHGFTARLMGPATTSLSPPEEMWWRNRQQDRME
ncbi:hypothetical protein K458DRAFT_131896 [Lentithecium fluviatile CBS 122367]|uniref:Secreted protein n=1 Tax=Lentithecium fluviatile CBS 122367 TaxID=1168545 RepID=A0A6G1JGR1_9PLEO|nr:hypothetical protein K458DRAFT_131896 [Lentithecium fluviatile CBS 122367]